GLLLLDTHAGRGDYDLAAAGPAPPDRSLDDTLAVFRRVAARIPQRHQSERNAARYLFRLGRDLLSPPWRSLSIFEAWRSFPHRAWRLAEAYRLQAKVIIAGHIHWSGIWRRRQGPTVVNTGAFCRPFHALAVDWRGDTLLVRRVAERGGLFYPGPAVAELHLDAASR
ncbi:MAG TPA: hypothetical protein VFE31_05780, partial [Opitutaceae bacterium]|nr:hypothetical protein [Opitutaceae bacterium]